MSLSDHPGFLAYEGVFPEVLHADWPAYPAGHGWETALKALAVFPPDVHFAQIDNIDQCRLFVAVGSGTCLNPKGDMTDPQWLHVAVWDDDLRDLHEKGLVSGISLITHYQAAMNEYHRLRDKFGNRDLYVEVDGKRLKLDPLKEPEREDEDELECPMVPMVDSQGISVTGVGNETLMSLTRPLGEIDEEIRLRVEPLLAISYYDTAIREASVILETKLRQVTGSKLFGPNLVDEYHEQLCKKHGTDRAIFKILRGELRMVFKFIRNDFAHSLREISYSQSRAHLDRIANALETIRSLEL